MEEIADTVKEVSQNRISRRFNEILKHPSLRDETFISQKFELDFIIRFSAAAFCGALLFSSLLLYYCSGTLTTSFENSRLVLQKTSLIVLPGVLYTGLIMLCLTAVVAAWLIIYLSNRIRKPFFRFRKNIQAIADGDLTVNLYYRRHDLAAVLAENINRMTLSVNTKVRDIENGIRCAIESAAENSVSDDVMQELVRLHRSIGQDFKL